MIRIYVSGCKRRIQAGCRFHEKGMHMRIKDCMPTVIFACMEEHANVSVCQNKALVSSRTGMLTQ